MSTRRRTKTSEVPVKKGENGHNLCRFCEIEVPKGRHTFCSQLCVEEWSVRSNTHFMRRKVFERDRGVCACCGLDANGWLEFVMRQPHSARDVLRDALRINNRITFWDVDHILPVSHGGGECGLENLQTLCIWCHRKKSLRDRGGKGTGLTIQDWEEIEITGYLP